MNKGEESGETMKSKIFVDLASIPTLQSIASISFATSLWTDSEIFQKLNQGCINTSPSEISFPQLQETVLEKLSKSPLPDLLKSAVSQVIQPIGMQLYKWFHERDQDYCSLYDLRLAGGEIFWTMEGTIDKARSLEELIKIDDRDPCLLYQLACKYCMEEHILDLWKKIPSNRKTDFDYDFTTSDCNDVIVVYWTFYVKRQMERMPEIMERIAIQIYDQNHNTGQNMISWSISVGNPFALKYFWQKLTTEEVNANIEIWLDLTFENMSVYRRYLDYNSHIDIVCFLLPRVKKELELKIILAYTGIHILRYLLESWPFHKYFLPTLIAMFPYIDYHRYEFLLLEGFFERGRTVVEPFKKMWLVTPLKLRQKFLEEDDVNSLTCLRMRYKPLPFVFDLLKTEDPNTALMMMRDLTTEKKEWLVRNIDFSEDLHKFIYDKNDFALVDIFLKEILPTGVDPQSLKQEIVLGFINMGLTDIFLKWIYQFEFKAIDSLFEWAFLSGDKAKNFKEKKVDPIKIYISLICHGDYSCVDQFMNWYFDTKEEISYFKKIFTHQTNSSYLKSLFYEIAHRSTINEAWNIFVKFTNFMLSSSDEIDKFKKLSFECAESVVSSRCFEFADCLLNWCATPEEVIQFKNDLILTEFGLQIIPPYHYVPYLTLICNKYANPVRLLKWASPLTSETITFLKACLYSDEALNRNLTDLEDERKEILDLLELEAGTI